MNTKNDFELLIRKFSHELRNPLTAMNSSLQLIECTHPEIKDVKYWKSLSDDVAYMIQLLEDFSSFSTTRLQKSSFSLNSLLKQVVLSFAATMVDSEIEFTSKITDKDLTLVGDSTKIQEVLRNLLKNAADACSPGDKISLTAACEKNILVISIEDTGCGIASEQLSTVFDPFVTYKKNGNGLGLPICKQIVEAHEGSISISSTLNTGTLVIVKLPTHD